MASVCTYRARFIAALCFIAVPICATVGRGIKTSAERAAVNSPVSELDLKIQSASSWAIALGTIIFLTSTLQIIGFLPGDTGWPNALIAIAVIALGWWTSEKPSPIPLVLLSVFFIAIIVDTIVATQFVISQFGFIAAILMLVRYVILLSAARAMGEALVALLNQRKIEESEERILSARESHEASGDATESVRATPTATPQLEPPPNPTVGLLKVMSAMLVVGAIIVTAAIPVRDGGWIFGLFMLVVASGAFYAAGKEKVYLPDLVADLRSATRSGDRNIIGQVADKLIPLKARASRSLAVAMLEDPGDGTFVAQSAAIIRQIGTLEQDAIAALRIGLAGNKDVVAMLDALEEDIRAPIEVAEGSSGQGDDFIPPIYGVHKAFVALMRRTREVAGSSIIVRGLGIIPLHGCDIPVGGFLGHMEAHKDVIEEAARARPFDEDEIWVATVGEQFLVTSKALYKLGGLPEWTLLTDIASLTDEVSMKKNLLRVHLKSGETVEYVVNWSTGMPAEVIGFVEPALDENYVGVLHDATRVHLAKAEGLRSGEE